MFFSRTPSIAPAEARERQRRGDLLLVDVREPGEVAAARIPGARSIPLGQLGDRLGELDSEKTVAFVCRSGARSGRAAKAAAKAGLDAVNVSGGLMGWTRDGLPVKRG
jgi:rhodanese-related sulfurtransferase